MFSPIYSNAIKVNRLRIYYIKNLKEIFYLLITLNIIDVFVSFFNCYLQLYGKIKHIQLNSCRC